MIKNLPENERPLEKAKRLGIKTLSNAELIALIINSGTAGRSAIGLAEEMLSVSGGGINDFPFIEAEEFMKIKGIGESKSYRICAAIELSSRMALMPVHDEYIKVPDQIARIFAQRLKFEKCEYMYAVCLDNKSKIICIEKISQGQLDGTLSHPREVFKQAIKKSAAAIIVVHNHPSGDPTPSREDISVTKRLSDSGNILGIRLLDHIIIGDGRFYSIMSESCRTIIL